MIRINTTDADGCCVRGSAAETAEAGCLPAATAIRATATTALATEATATTLQCSGTGCIASRRPTEPIHDWPQVRIQLSVHHTINDYRVSGYNL